ncbi:MAG: hypothetical protein IJP66_09180, partial [Kiritimatiellae bacterium]|nr:hypothetical protein [Kiritimatiellia bacterium]
MDALKIIADGKADVLAPVCAVLAKRRDGWRAADFYDATLAWQGRKWEEARRLHRKFAEKYAGTPLADYVRQSRLPDI